MMLQWLLLLTLFVHNSLAFGLYDDTDGKCFCNGDSGETFKAYMNKSDIRTQVQWVVPMTCTGGASYTVYPRVSPGDRFGRGQYVITYTSSYTNDVKCDVHFQVVACGCPCYNTITFKSPLGGPDPTYPVSWEKPKPVCKPGPAGIDYDDILEDNSANTLLMNKQIGYFRNGEYTFTYKYRVGGKFDLECDVKFAVP